MWDGLKCFLWGHDFETLKDAGKYVYKECTRCKERLIYERIVAGYQPVDRQWLKTGRFLLPPTNGPKGKK